ncbi:hypothetical protein ACFL2V_10615, partial [Pseudomonadota bacterium]
MNKYDILFNRVMQPGTTRDLLFLALMMLFVSNSMPVTIMGNENAAEYFFSEKSTKVIRSVNNCLNPYQPCTVKLDENTHLSVMMPALVSITDPFDVSAKITGVE